MRSTGIFILNVARSGSSVLAGILDRLGVYGGNDLADANAFNPRGFYESKEIIKLHNETQGIWNKLDPERNSIMSPPSGWHRSQEISELKDRLRNLLKSSYLQNELWYLKEPSLMRLLPIYFDLGEELGFDIKICFIYRHPVEVAYSIHDYSKIDILNNVLMWLKYNIDAELETRNLKRIFTSYDNILYKWKEVIEKLKKGLDVDIAETGIINAGLIVNPIYRGYNINNFDDLANTDLAGYAAKIYGAFRVLESEGQEEQKENALKTFGEINQKILDIEKGAQLVNGKKVINIPIQLRKLDNSITRFDTLPLIFKQSILYMEPSMLSNMQHWHAHIPFAFWLVENQRPEVAVEFGVYKGDSYFAFCQAVKHCGLDDFTKCIGIQTYQEAQNPDNKNNQGNTEVYKGVLKYNERYDNFSTVIKPDLTLPLDVKMETLKDAAGGRSIEKIDLLHFNAYISYETVKKNFENLEPYLSDRAIILINYIIPRTENITVWKFYEEITQKYPSFILNIDSGLGVILAGKEIQKHPSVSKFVLHAYGDIINIFNNAGIRLAKIRNKKATL